VTIHKEMTANSDKRYSLCKAGFIRNSVWVRILVGTEGMQLWPLEVSNSSEIKETRP